MPRSPDAPITRFLKVSCPFLEFHGAILVVIDHAVLALRTAQGNQLLNDFWYGICIRANCAGTRTASQRSHTAADQLRLFSWSEGNKGLFQRDQRFAAHRHPALFGKIERHNGDLLHVDVKPDIQLRPIRKWKHPNAFSQPEFAVKQSPYLRPLVLRVPLAFGIAKRIDSFFGPRPLFIPARPAKSGIKSALLQSS